MGKAIGEFLDFLSPGAVMADLKSACRRMVDDSDIAIHASANLDAEHDAIAEEILQFILFPDEKEMREIVFDPPHKWFGTSIEICEFASMLSSHFLIAYHKESWDQPFPDSGAHARRILEYYAALLFRYSWCVRTDAAALPVSGVIEFAEQCDVMRRNRGQESNVPGILHLATLALRECEADLFA